MKLLFDQNLSYRLVEIVSVDFPGSSHVGRLHLQESMDRDIWEYAKTHGFTIVSKDDDFFNLASIYGPPPHFIWIRTGNTSSRVVAELLLKYKHEIKIFLSTNDAILEIQP